MLSRLWRSAGIVTVVLPISTALAVHARAQTPAAPGDDTPSVLAQAGPSAPQGTPTSPADVGGTAAPGAAQTHLDIATVNVAHALPSASGTRAQALRLKQDAPNFVEVQPQSEIKKLPDVSVAEALQRVSGISLETDSGEGRFINIRGLDADLNGVSFDGVRLQPSNVASPFGGGRAIALDSIPAGFVGGLEVIKTLRPDEDAEALGGQINIVPREPPTTGQPFVDLNVGSGYEPLRASPVVQGGITLGGSFGLGRDGGLFDPAKDTGQGFFSNAKPFSVLGTATQYNDQRGVDDVEEAYVDQQSAGVPDKALNELDLRRYQYNRRRYSHGGELEYTPDPLNRFYFRFAEAGYDEHVSRHQEILTNLASDACATENCYADPYGFGILAPTATVEQTLRDETESIRSNVVEWGGRNVLNSGIVVDYRGSFSSGDYNKPYDYNSTFTNPNTVSLAYNNLTDPFHPSVRVLDGTNLADPGGYNLTGLNNSQERANDHEWDGFANVGVPADFHGVGTLRFGAGARLRQHEVTETFQNYSANPDLPPISFSGYNFGSDQIFYDHRYNIGPMVDGGVRALIGSPFLTEDVAADVLAGQQAYQNDHENVYSGYGQYEWQHGRLGLLAGIRVEGTDAVYGANQSLTDSAGNVTVTPAKSNEDYVDYFPTLQARYTLAPNLIGRLAYSTSIGRPGFNQITAATNIDVGNGIVTKGNPALAPTTADDFDISVERYIQHAGLISVGAFDKQFHNYILPSSLTGTYPGISGIVRLQSFSNGGEARATGVELQFIRMFDFLPAPFDGFGVDSNYTYVDSTITIRQGETSTLPSTSPNNFNVALLYEKGPIDFRFATAFVSRNLYAIGSSRATDIFSAPRFRIDIGSSYAITRHLSVYVDMKNLTDTPLQFTEGPTNTRPTQREFYDATYLAGLRSSF